ncbi:MAG: hypothetical protein JRN16_05920 [Nitrososphaerota archaeon]|nr:hypothetical protein [Nitrososphaerota archaeon]MDG7027928.1 hypothetical protein [Nitrososphaerota archaeon]
MKLQKRRGLSPIIAELILVAITVVIGITVFYAGSSAVGGYSNGFSLLFSKGAGAAQEIYVVEYAQFGTGNVNITVRNVGYVTLELVSVDIFNDSAVGAGYPTSGVFTNTTSPALTRLPSDASPYCYWDGQTLLVPVGTFCNVNVAFDSYTGAAYNVVVSTDRGNSIVDHEVA